MYFLDEMASWSRSFRTREDKSCDTVLTHALESELSVLDAKLLQLVFLQKYSLSRYGFASKTFDILFYFLKYTIGSDRKKLIWDFGMDVPFELTWVHKSGFTNFCPYVFKSLYPSAGRCVLLDRFPPNLPWTNLPNQRGQKEGFLKTCQNQSPILEKVSLIKGFHFCTETNDFDKIWVRNSP